MSAAIYVISGLLLFSSKISSSDGAPWGPVGTKSSMENFLARKNLSKYPVPAIILFANISLCHHWQRELTHRKIIIR